MCSCSGQLIHRFGPCVMTDDWWKLPTGWTGVARGKWCPGVDRAVLSPCGIRAHRTSLDRRVLAKTAESMGQELPGLLPDLRWICQGRYSFQAIYLSFTADSWTRHQERNKGGRHMSPVGEISFKGFNGGKKQLDRNLV